MTTPEIILLVIVGWLVVWLALVGLVLVLQEAGWRWGRLRGRRRRGYVQR